MYREQWVMNFPNLASAAVTSPPAVTATMGDDAAQAFYCHKTRAATRFGPPIACVQIVAGPV